MIIRQLNNFILVFELLENFNYKKHVIDNKIYTIFYGFQLNFLTIHSRLYL